MVGHTGPVSAKTLWRVTVHNDRVSSFAVVVHLVHSLCATPLEDAVRVVTHVQDHGSAEVAALPERDGAERLVVALQRHGLNATVRRA
jgi:ATP-dependent Clp protease adapter protein ClpS